MRITSVPAPRILAPIPLRKIARSTTSGSFAAFSKVVTFTEGCGNHKVNGGSHARAVYVNLCTPASRM